jgi:hypothetical protein
MEAMFWSRGLILSILTSFVTPLNSCPAEIISKTRFPITAEWSLNSLNPSSIDDCIPSLVKVDMPLPAPHLIRIHPCICRLSFSDAEKPQRGYISAYFRYLSLFFF